MLIPQGFVPRMVVFGEPHRVLILIFAVAFDRNSLEERCILELGMTLTGLLFGGT